MDLEDFHSLSAAKGTMTYHSMTELVHILSSGGRLHTALYDIQYDLEISKGQVSACQNFSRLQSGLTSIQENCVSWLLCVKNSSKIKMAS